MHLMFQGDIHELYSRIDKESITPTDRQVFNFNFRHVIWIV